MLRLIPCARPRRSRTLASVATAAVLALASPAHAQLLSRPPSIDAYGLSGPGFLVRFDTRSPRRTSTTVGWMFPESGGALIGLDRRAADGELYAVDNRGVVYRVNPTTALLTTVGRIDGGLIGAFFGVDFHPQTGRLHVLGDTGRQLAFDITTGATIRLPDLRDAGTGAALVGVSAFAFDADGAAYALDHETDRLLSVDIETGIARPIAALRSNRRFGRAPTLIGGDGFDILGSTAQGTAVAMVSLKPESQQDAVLHQLDLGTATARAIGSIDPDPAGDLLDFTLIP